MLVKYLEDKIDFISCFYLQFILYDSRMKTKLFIDIIDLCWFEDISNNENI